MNHTKVNRLLVIRNFELLFIDFKKSYNNSKSSVTSKITSHKYSNDTLTRNLQMYLNKQFHNIVQPNKNSQILKKILFNDIISKFKKSFKDTINIEKTNYVINKLIVKDNYSLINFNCLELNQAIEIINKNNLTLKLIFYLSDLQNIDKFEKLLLYINSSPLEIRFIINIDMVDHNIHNLCITNIITDNYYNIIESNEKYTEHILNIEKDQSILNLWSVLMYNGLFM